MRYKVYLTNYASAVNLDTDFQIEVVDPCTSSSFSLNPANVLLTTPPPIASYNVAEIATELTWPLSEVISTAISACGTINYELWDVTSGSEVDPTTANII